MLIAAVSPFLERRANQVGNDDAIVANNVVDDDRLTARDIDRGRVIDTASGTAGRTNRTRSRCIVFNR